MLCFLFSWWMILLGDAVLFLHLLASTSGSLFSTWEWTGPRDRAGGLCPQWMDGFFGQ